MDAPSQALSETIQPVWLGRLVDELNHARGRGLVPPLVKTYLVIAVPALFIAWAVSTIYPGPAGPDVFGTPWRAFLSVVLFAPVFETMLMRFMFWLVGKLLRQPHSLNLGCALLWGVMHVQSPTWGLHAVWVFYVLGAIFLRLQVRSLNRAYGVVILLHALLNLLAYGAYLLG